MVFNALVPPFELETVKARAALPATLPFKDAASFIARDYETLGVACKDRLHEDYRAPLIPGFQEVAAAARAAGALVVFLSGAGPTVMAICRAGDSGFAEALAPAMRGREGGAWTLLEMRADDQGASLEAEPGIFTSSGS